MSARKSVGYNVLPRKTFARPTGLRDTENIENRIGSLRVLEGVAAKEDSSVRIPFDPREKYLLEDCKRRFKQAARALQPEASDNVARFLHALTGPWKAKQEEVPHEN